MIAAEPEITRYDTIAGDGDAGLTLKAGAQGILNAMSVNRIPDNDVVAAMVACSEVVEREMGGTSGGLYAIALSGLSKGLVEAARDRDSEVATAEVWARGLEVRGDGLSVSAASPGTAAASLSLSLAFVTSVADLGSWSFDDAQLALNTLYRYTRARPPSRTLVDPLSSFILTFASDPTNLTHAIKAAQEAAEATRDLDAKAGRAAYVDQEKIREASVPDAGAWGVWKLLEGMQKAL